MPNIECPICESIFAIPKSTKLNQGVICPECGESFPATRELLTLPTGPPAIAGEPATGSPDISPELPLADPQNGPPPLANNQPDVTNPTPTDQSVAVLEQKKVHSRIAHNNRKSKLVPLFIIGTLVIASIGLVVVLWQVIKNGPTVTNKDESSVPTPVVKPDPNSNSEKPKRPKKIWLTPGELGTSGDPSAAGDQSIDIFSKPPSSDFPLQVRSSSFWPKSKMEAQWREYHPRLVRLTVETPAGKHEALGTVVDSRGWIATSLRAVSGAAKIRVKQLSSRFAQIGETDLLEDLVRGVVATDPEADLAILSVNRRFVVAFDAIKFSTKDRLVGSQRVAVPFFPDQNSETVIREHKIDGRKMFDQLAPEQQTKLAAIGLDSDTVEWVEFQLLQAEAMPSVIVAGAPLINEDGEFSAMATHARSEENYLAIPATQITNLIATATNDVKPLAILNADLEKIGIETIDPDTIVADEHPLKALSIKLNQSGEACAGFDWQPTGFAQYQTMQNLLRQIVEMQTFMDGNPDDAAAEKFQQQIDHWYSQIDSKIAGGFSAEMVSAFNSLAAESIKSDARDFFFVFATVKFAALDGPKLNSDDAVTFELKGTTDLITVPFNAELPRMLPDSTWLLACYPPRSRMLNFNYNGYSHKTRPTSLVFVIGPVK